MEQYISKDAPEPGPLTAGSTSPGVSGRIVVDTVDLDLLWEHAHKSGVLFDPTGAPKPENAWKVPVAAAPPPRRRVTTSISKTVCAILHKPSGEYVEKGFRGLTKNPEKIKFWNRKSDAKKVLSNWFHYNPEVAATPDEFYFIEREIFLPSTEVV